jgi:hypothetical protein
MEDSGLSYGAQYTNHGHLLTGIKPRGSCEGCGSDEKRFFTHEMVLAEEAKYAQKDIERIFKALSTNKDIHIMEGSTSHLVFETMPSGTYFSINSPVINVAYYSDFLPGRLVLNLRTIPHQSNRDTLQGSVYFENGAESLIPVGSAKEYILGMGKQSKALEEFFLKEYRKATGCRAVAPFRMQALGLNIPKDHYSQAIFMTKDEPLKDGTIFSFEEARIFNQIMSDEEQIHGIDKKYCGIQKILDDMGQRGHYEKETIRSNIPEDGERGYLHESLSSEDELVCTGILNNNRFSSLASLFSSGPLKSLLVNHEWAGKPFLNKYENLAKQTKAAAI